ncbi:MAG TPA: hypothetical protein VFB38_11260 [Chthonomonadaceae bacterium]|nr:hypothetical protein [Chthonomonadaceae bacterium]
MQVMAALGLVLIGVGLTMWISSFLTLLRRKKPLTLSRLIAESSLPFLAVAVGLKGLEESGYLLPSTRGWREFVGLLMALAFLIFAYGYSRSSWSGHNKQ